jgi:hypothetical protein
VQDVDQASLDRSRPDAYLAATRQAAETDPVKVHDIWARGEPKTWSLNAIKV